MPSTESVQSRLAQDSLTTQTVLAISRYGADDVRKRASQLSVSLAQRLASIALSSASAVLAVPSAAGKTRERK